MGEAGNVGQVGRCTNDPATDSASETGGAETNNIFSPAICFSTTATVLLNTATFNLLDEASLDLERAYQGLLTMGTKISTTFDLSSDPGHLSKFTIVPPSYATITAAGGVPDTSPSTLDRSDGQNAYKVGYWELDNRGGSDGLLPSRSRDLRGPDGRKEDCWLVRDALHPVGDP